jgi:excisionase family DNA binding protein
MTGKDFSESPATGTIVDLPQQDRGPRLYTVAAAAHELGVSERKVWTLLGAGRLKSVLLDGRRLIPAAVLDEFVAALLEEASDLEVVAA